MLSSAPRPTLLVVLASAVALSLGLLSLNAQAMGLGRPQVHSPLGKPLDLSFPLSLAPGERVPERCVRAEVSAGEARVPAGLLRTQLEGEPGRQQIRLQSLEPIAAPALRVTLAVGCPVQLTREFQVVIEPANSADAQRVAPAMAYPVPRAVPSVVPLVAPATVPPAAVMAASAPARAASAASPASRQRSRPKPQAAGPRLVLEAPTVQAGRPKPRPPSADAANGADEVYSPELEAQITLLEQSVVVLRAELEARVRARANAASAAAAVAAAPASASASAATAVASASAVPAVAREASAPAMAASEPGAVPPYEDPLTWLLTLALGLLAGAAAFYGSRWFDERSRRDAAHWRTVHATEGGATSVQASAGFAFSVAPDEGLPNSTRPQPQPMPWAPAPQDLGPALEAVDPGVAAELLDLQQQADFLQLLGQHDAAADLLANRLIKGDAGAMVYLMLMEICQQRGDQPVFAELTRQYEQRFRIQAPSWSLSLSRGRGLDACTSVIAHLQVVWSDPSAALRLVQELVARGGGPGVPHFELPAFRDLLMLYSVARDLFEAGQRGDQVDLMLPLDSRLGGV
ncbi:FimV family protein [Roseateles sp. BYS96W]|uniref:FimV family protein n=1 Tax=Pelomonas nitida TaxID=3299027 RepID=A0ABW7G785_9BURK